MKPVPRRYRYAKTTKKTFVTDRLDNIGPMLTRIRKGLGLRQIDMMAYSRTGTRRYAGFEKGKKMLTLRQLELLLEALDATLEIKITVDQMDVVGEI